MTYSSLGAKRQPQFADADAPDVAVNPTQVANYAAEYGNYKVDTAAARTTAAAWAWEGLLWRDTDSNKVLWKFTSGAWKSWESPWIAYVPTYSGLTLGSGGVALIEYRYAAGDVEVKWKLTFGTSGSWAVPGFTLPVAPNTTWLGTFGYLGDGVAAQAAALYSLTINYFPTGGLARLYVSTVPVGVLNGASPFAPASGDFLSGRLSYTPA